MAKDVFSESLMALKKHAAQTENILVGYSGGKESCVCMDLCFQAGFKNIVAYHLWTFPDLDFIKERMDYARERWGVTEVFQAPNRIIFLCLKYGVYRTNHYMFDKVPDFKPKDLENYVREATGINTIVMGRREKDSQSRKRMFARHAKQADYIFPIAGWTKWDVLAYLETHKIPLPPTEGGQTSGVSTSHRSCLYMAEHHPKDFVKIETWLPFFGAIVARKKWFDLPDDATLQIKTHKYVAEPKDLDAPLDKRKLKEEAAVLAEMRGTK